MKTGFAEHFIFGLVLAIIGLLVFNGSASFTTSTICVITFITGSILPDVDCPSSTPRKTFRKLLALALGVVAILFLYNHYNNIFPYCSTAFGNSCILFIPLATLLLAFLAYKFIDKTIPSHRGILHSPFSALAFSVICFFISNYSIPVAVSSFLGYLAHLALDFAGDRI
ncbi:metal-dependent hydrolase [Candidatus Micrarchaeota archaeon]|nr:metal-dependent hydrolase [Candidatus Micrarchaeota archaeon]